MGYVGRSGRRSEDERLVQGAGCFVGDVNPLGMVHAAAKTLLQRFGYESSFVHLNDTPGFGVEIDWDYAKRHAA